MEKRVAKCLPFMASVLETQMPPPPTLTPSTHMTSTLVVPTKTYWFVLQVSEKVLANEGVLLLKVQRKCSDSLYDYRLLWDDLSHALVSLCICLHFPRHPTVLSERHQFKREDRELSLLSSWDISHFCVSLPTTYWYYQKLLFWELKSLLVRFLKSREEGEGETNGESGRKPRH